MDSNLMAQMTRALCKELHSKYGYNEKECQAYIKGYRDCEAFQSKTFKYDVPNCNSDLEGCEYGDGLGAQRSI